MSRFMAPLTENEIQSILIASGSMKRKCYKKFDKCSSDYTSKLRIKAEKQLRNWTTCGMPQKAWDILNNLNAAVIKKFDLHSTPNLEEISVSVRFTAIDI